MFDVEYSDRSECSIEQSGRSECSTSNIQTTPDHTSSFFLCELESTSNHLLIIITCTKLGAYIKMRPGIPRTLLATIYAGLDYGLCTACGIPYMYIRRLSFVFTKAAVSLLTTDHSPVNSITNMFSNVIMIDYHAVVSFYRLHYANI